MEEDNSKHTEEWASFVAQHQAPQIDHVGASTHLIGRGRNTPTADGRDEIEGAR